MSAEAAALLAFPEMATAFSLATIRDVRIKTPIGRANFSVDPGMDHRAPRADGFAEMAIDARHLFRLATLLRVHRDPFDRVPVVQAMEDRMTLVTADSTLERSGRFVRAV